MMKSWPTLSSPRRRRLPLALLLLSVLLGSGLAVALPTHAQPSSWIGTALAPATGGVNLIGAALTGGATPNVVSSVWNFISVIFLELLISIISIIAWVMVWGLYLASQIVGPVLGLSQFVTSPFVTTGWPFLLGIANLGFIFALLFMAFATVLQLDLGGGLKRWLPRLLLAAILVNFSLIIGGVIIDSSRILMAILVRSISDQCTVTNIGVCVLEKSQLLSINYQVTHNSFLGYIDRSARPDVSFDLVAKAALSLVLIAALTFGMWLVLLILLVRYIMLTLLLIVSPLAFLSLAFPGLQQYSSKWWGEFLRYVFLGPIALFMLILIVKLSDGAGTLGTLTNNGFFQTFLSFAITIGLLVAIYKYGKQISGSIATATMSIASREAWKRPGLTGAVVGGLLSGGALTIPAMIGTGLGFRWGKAATIETGRQVREAVAPARKSVRKGIRGLEVGGVRVGRMAFGPERDKETGKLLKGESSTGQRVGRWLAGTSLGGALYEKGQMMAQWEQAMKDAAARISSLNMANPADMDRVAASVRAHPAYTKLSSDRVGDIMEGKQGEAVFRTALRGDVGHSISDFERLKTMVGNPHAFNPIKDSVRAEIVDMDITTVVRDINARRAAPDRITAADDEYKRLERLIRDIKNKAESSWKTVRGDDWV